MKKIITAHECKTMLEYIFNNVLDNGEGFQIFENSQMTIGDYRVKGEVKVAILTSKDYKPQIYIDQDYDVLSEETEYVCVVSVDELLSWDRKSDTHPFAEDSDLKEDELYLREVNNIIGKLFLLYSEFGNTIWDFSLENFKNQINHNPLKEEDYQEEISYESDGKIGDDEEVYILYYYSNWDEKFVVKAFRDKEDLIYDMYSLKADGFRYTKSKWGEVKDSLF